ncbi:ferrous iron transport protein B [Planctomycetota bacterium]
MNFKDIRGKDDTDSCLAIKKIAIVGLPNTGKSQVFNNLTGEYTLVANYPLTTVDMKRSRCRINGQAYEVIDTPGLHCLYIHSQEELVVRDMIFKERPDMIIQCIDANRLKQSLTLTSDLLELEIPMAISLNSIDETSRKGVWIDSAGLSRFLGVPAIESVAINGVGTKQLKKVIERPRKGKGNLKYGEIVDDGISTIVSHLPKEIGFKRKKAALLLLDDPFIADYLSAELGQEKAAHTKNLANDIKQQFRGNISHVLNNKRSKWVDQIAEKTVRKQKISPGQFSKSFARLSRHPVFGLPILFLFLLTTYLLVVHGAGFIEEMLNLIVVVPAVNYVTGVLPSGFWHDFLIGHYGVLTLGFFNAVVTVLPILSVYFLAFGFLEDIGYIPNLCVLTKRLLEKIGLTGKAIMPLVLAFGCKTMATFATRGLSSRKEKFIAVYLIAFAIPCSAQLAIGMGIMGKVGFGAFLIAYGALAIVELIAGFVLNKFIKEEKQSDFLQELPAIRVPNIRAVLVKTYYRLYWFLKEALPVFVIAAVVMFLADKIGLLGHIKTILHPVVVGWLNLPVDVVDACILLLARHEAAAAFLLKMVNAGTLNYTQCIVAVVLTATFFPCFANVVAVCKEMGVKTGIAMALAINMSSFVLASILNLILISIFGR